MEFLTVQDRKTKILFHNVARQIYEGDQHWVCPLETEIEAIFDPNKNEFFKHGSAIRYILLDDSGEILGRIGAFINKKKAYTFQQATGGVGFFECVENKEAAFALFDKAKEWLKEQGMEAMDGPINFGENDNYWGLLVEGFTHPAYGMQYHKPYYKEFFEDCGFRLYFEQVSNHLDLTKPFPERFWKIADWVRQRPGYEYKHLEMKNVHKYVQDFKEVYDTAWQFHENFTPIDEQTLLRTLQSAKVILEEEFIWFAYHEGKPIAFLIMFPDINQILKHLNGKLHLRNQLKFIYLKKKKTITRARILIMGIVPQFQKAGVESAIFWHLQKVMETKPWYTEIELSWVGDFNPKMRALHESVGASFAKRHITYRVLFNETKTFERSSIIPTNTKEKFIEQQH